MPPAQSSVRFDFSGAHVLVTGGSNGIGRAVAGAFADAGAARVIISGTRASASEYQHDLGRYDYQQLDLRRADQIAALVARLDHLDILVNNAGANFARQPSEWDPDVFEDSLRLNLSGAFRLALACKPLLMASTLEGGASIINVASMSAYFAVPVVPGYGAAKAGIVQMTKNLAVAWAAEKIRVNAVAPGLIESNMTAGLKSFAAAAQPHLDRTAMHRWGQPADVVPTFLFLASAAARFITGQTVCVDGGYSIS